MARPDSPTPSRHNNLPMTSHDIMIYNNTTKQVMFVDDKELDNKILETVTADLNRYFVKLKGTVKRKRIHNTSVRTCYECRN